ncbi:MAG TPA: type ISP restriction/modification enzyme [Candidatus Lokiarchaeia archaeon]|nr:type ISP restriction/modification enzyme [Candidatus Lokiarchaeia archaeon]
MMTIGADIENFVACPEKSGLLLDLPTEITKLEQLAELLANRAQYFLDLLKAELTNNPESPFCSRLKELCKTVKAILIQNFDIGQFLDAYVQIVTYSFFIAKLKAKASIIDASNWFSFIPIQESLLHDLFMTTGLDYLPSPIIYVLQSTWDVLNATNVSALNEFVFRGNSDVEEDPLIYFYEVFLRYFDRAKKRSKGVYYTPTPVVQFIINCVDEILRADFQMVGVQDRHVQVLDFATGTGAFLLEVFKHALRETPLAEKSPLIRDHLLKDATGLESMLAPQMIAHLRLATFLQDEAHYTLGSNEIIPVHLSDTLLHDHPALITLAAPDIEHVLAVIGNPPYNVRSQNTSPFITDLCQVYKDGLGEQNIQSLSDDYIKFIRYAQWLVEGRSQGMVAIITNNSFLQGLIHREMRRNLLSTFDKLYLLNLHGHSRLDHDENVFDIKEVGVSIAVMVKLALPLAEKEVYYASTFELNILTRAEKFAFLEGNTVSTINWTRLTPSAPAYRFVPVDTTASDEAEYGAGWSLPEIFAHYGSATETGKDYFFLAFPQEKEVIITRIRDALGSPDAAGVQEQYQLHTTKGGWKYESFRKCIFSEKFIIPYLYRPFDTRLVYFDPAAIQRPRYPKSVKNVRKNREDREPAIMELLVSCTHDQAIPLNGNIAIISVRQFAENVIFNHVFVTDKISDVRVMMSNKGKGYIFPLFKRDSCEVNHDNCWVPNFTPDFEASITKLFGLVPSPPQVFGYIYAILHSNIYRQKYNEFLKIDFPKIPFPTDSSQFVKIAELGQQLINAHLLNQTSEKDQTPTIECREEEKTGESHDWRVNAKQVQYHEEYQRLYFNTGHFLDQIEKEVWQLNMGGYQVLNKWLKSRNGQVLTPDDFNTIRKMVAALRTTLSCIAAIDAVVGEFIKG